MDWVGHEASICHQAQSNRLVCACLTAMILLATDFDPDQKDASFSGVSMDVAVGGDDLVRSLSL